MAPRPVIRAALPLHPFLFAAFPVLFLYAQNVRYAVTWRDVVAPLAVVILGTSIILLFAWIALRRRWAAAALATSVLVLLFFSYGPVYRAIEAHPVAGVRLARHALLLPLWAALAIGSFLLAARFRDRLPSLNRGLNLVAGGLVLINLTTIVVNEAAARREVPVPQTSATIHPGSRRPDIYYIVFEEYAGERTLRRYFDYDNQQFLAEIERRGFFVAHQAFTNYPRTSLSLASSMNMDYLGQVARTTGGAGPERVLIPLIQSPRVVSLLKSVGYRYVNIGSWYTPTATSPQADVNIRFGGLSEFDSALYANTPLWPVGQKLGLLRNDLDFRRREYERVLFQFGQLARMRSVRGPKLVFAHIVSPHDPYVFDRQGRYVPEAGQGGRQDKRDYADQLTYLNTLILRLIDTLLSVPEDRRPVIVLQADEGPFPGAPTAWPQPPDVLERKFLILNSYYLPPGGRATSAPYPAISPVNTFRLVLNRYLGGEFPLLPDRAFTFRNLKDLYTFSEVTDQVKALAAGG
jgi:hypothetical protein